MNPKRLRRLQFRLLSFFSSLFLWGFAVITTGCGSGGMSSVSTTTTSQPSGDTTVTVQLSSTANDQLSQYDVGFGGLTLTSQSGKTVNLLPVTAPSPPYSEFMHLNGLAQPLFTTTVPQDVYTSASATPSGFSGGFACVSKMESGTLQTSYFVAPQSVTINLPSPITVTGTAMALSLDLQVSQSAAFSNCYLPEATFTDAPVFNLIPVMISSQPANMDNGGQKGIEGLVASVSASGFNLTTADGTSLSVKDGSSTVYQGVSGLSALAANMAIEMDAAIQPDGSLLAQRVAVEDSNTATVTVVSGPVLAVLASEPVMNLFGREQQGYLLPTQQGGAFSFSFNGAVFQTSGQLANLQKLPFVASFNSANMFAGQNVFVSMHATVLSGGPPTFTPVSTVTLVPQTINGTISAVGNAGGFSTYTVALAPYDLIPNVAVLPGQTTVLTDPGNVIVYMDSNTQMLNTTPLAEGSVLRFNGLLFNDNGTLRMDCGQVNDGVAE